MGDTNLDNIWIGDKDLGNICIWVLSVVISCQKISCLEISVKETLVMIVLEIEILVVSVNKEDIILAIMLGNI